MPSDLPLRAKRMSTPSIFVVVTSLMSGRSLLMGAPRCLKVAEDRSISSLREIIKGRKENSFWSKRTAVRRTLRLT
jgi:hypothetical protein